MAKKFKETTSNMKDFLQKLDSMIYEFGDKIL